MCKHMLYQLNILIIKEKWHAIFAVAYWYDMHVTVSSAIGAWT